MSAAARGTPPAGGGGDEAATGPVPASQLGAIAGVARRCVTYSHTGLGRGSHLGLPSPELTLVLGIDGPTQLAAMPDPSQPPARLDALIGGLHTRPAVIAYDGRLRGVELDLAPQAARRLLGVPAAELAHAVVDLHDLLGAAAAELLDRAHATGSWAERVAVVVEVLQRRLGRAPAAPPQADRAWRLIASSGGAARIAAVADAVGWSRRRLDQAFRAEFGVTPKEAARLARFARSHQLLTRQPAARLAEVASHCGYSDQAHMAREWNQLAGVPASTWLAEDFPFVQAAGSATSSSSAA